MKLRFPRIVCVCACLAAVTVFGAMAQSRPSGGMPGGPPPGAPGLGAPGAPGGPGGSSGPNGARPQVSSARGTTRATGNALQFGPVGRWWDDKAAVQAVGLTRDQQKKMDEIFSENKPAILASYKTFLREQSKLEAINKDIHVDQARLFAAIDAVNQARSSLQKATSQMLLQIRQQMNSEQITKLRKLQ